MAPVTRSHSVRIAGFPDIADETSAEHRTRTIHVNDGQDGPHTSENTSVRSDTHKATPPIYTIDLSLPPSERYVQAATDYKEEIRSLTGLFEEVVTGHGLSLKPVTVLAPLFLRSLYNKEQTEEIRGVSRTTGVPMYLMVAFNVLLDLFMGCTSGGMKVWDDESKETSGSKPRKTKMLHFRSLDWGMDALRKTIVQLEFIEKPGAPVIARSITYVGFVGILTGVRPGLSVSLNFRPYHNDSSSRMANFRFYSNHLLVLLGLRPSISSILRDFIIPPQLSSKSKERKVRTNKGPWFFNLADQSLLLQHVNNWLGKTATTAAYLIFCSGQETVILEKDLRTAVTHSSSSFVVVTNHDAISESTETAPSAPTVSDTKQHEMLGMQDLVEESQQRKGCMVANWEAAVEKYLKKNKGASEDDVAVRSKDVVRWVQKYPITNEETHYSCVMDPSTGGFIWVKKYKV